MAAQSFLNLDVAQNFSTFKFSYNPILNDNIQPYPNPEYSQISTTAFGAGYSYLHTSGVFASGGLSFRKAGASLVYKKINYLWNLQYFDVKAGLGYQYDKWRIKPLASIIPYYAYLMNAKQSIGLNYYDVKADKALKEYDLGLLLNLGANIALSQYIAIYAEYGYNLGLKNIEPGEAQYLYNRGFAIKLGLSISITNLKNVQSPVAIQPQQLPDNTTDNGIQPTQFQVTDVNKNNPAPAQNTNGTSTNNISSNQTKSSDEKITTPGTVGSTDKTSPPSQKNKNTSLSSETQEEANNITTNQNQAIPSHSNSSGTQTNSIAQNTSNTSNSNSANKSGTSEIPTNSTSLRTTNTNANTENSNNVNSRNENSAAQSAASKPPVTPSLQTAVVTSTSSSENNKISATKEEKSEPEIKPTEKKLNSDNKIVFKIQLTAVKNSLRRGHPILKNIKGDIKAEKGRDGWIRYYLGAYKTYEEAQKELKKIKAKGMADDGFIVAFKNGRKITVAQAKELLK